MYCGSTSQHMYAAANKFHSTCCCCALTSQQSELPRSQPVAGTSIMLWGYGAIRGSGLSCCARVPQLYTTAESVRSGSRILRGNAVVCKKYYGIYFLFGIHFLFA